MQRSIDDVIDTLRDIKRRNRKCAVLIGAGCSVTAGIPTAQQFVEIIKERYPREYERATQKSYPECMSRLSTDQQRDLITDYVENAKVNWGHIALTQLIQAGYVDRVLTTNFDPLVVRACALIGKYPAVYDFAVSDHFKPEKIRGEAVFHLHGQYTGFIQIHTREKSAEHKEIFRSLIEDTTRNRIWLVVGYSGESDPVFEQLVNIPSFDNRLYWIGYKDSEPAAHIRERLLIEGKDAYYVNGFDADNFFVTVARELKCFPPDFVRKPFTYLERMLEGLSPYDISPDSQQLNFLEQTRSVVKGAIAAVEPVYADLLDAWADYLSGSYEKVVALKDKEYFDVGIPLGVPPPLKVVIALAYIQQGEDLVNQAIAESGGPRDFNSPPPINVQTADSLFRQAIDKYVAALSIEPDMYVAFHNWGLCLYYQAQIKSGDQVDRLLELAYSKYEIALEIKPDSAEVLTNWGGALHYKGLTKSGQEAEDLFKQAIEKYEAAVQIYPNFLTIYNLGLIFKTLAADAVEQGAADGLYMRAYEKFDAALKINPEFYKAFFFWGNALYNQALAKDGDEANLLLQQSIEKYESCLKIKPDHEEALYELGAILIIQAENRTGKEADLLYKKAYEKFKKTLQIKPNDNRVIKKWSRALLSQAATKKGKEADALYQEAFKKFESGIKLNPGNSELQKGLGQVLFAQAMDSSEDEANELLKQAGESYETAFKLNPNDHVILGNWGHVLFEQAKKAPAEKGNDLINLSIEKYTRALEIEPNYFYALYGLGVILLSSSQLVSEDQRGNLLEKAEKLLAQAENISKGSAAYYLASIAALRNQSEECKKWLMISQENGQLPQRDFLERNPDFKNVIQADWFQEFLRELT